VRANGSKTKNARLYLNPAYVNRGISDKPHLISIKDVDHRKVTKSASRIAFKCG
jgi:hypothetical protein